MRKIRFLNRDTPPGIFQSGYWGALYWVVDEGEKHAVQLYGTPVAPAFTAFALDERSIAWGEWLFPVSVVPNFDIDVDLDGDLSDMFDLGTGEGAPGQICHSDGTSLMKVFSCDAGTFHLKIPSYDRLLAGSHDFSGYCDDWTLIGDELVGSVFTRHDWEFQYQCALRWENY